MSSFTEITVDDLAALSEEIHLIDVREVDEYESGHIPGAINIPLQQIPDHVDQCRHRGGGVTYMVCKVGGRSASACDYLHRLDLKVVNVAGGTAAWMMNGHPVIEGREPS